MGLTLDLISKLFNAGKPTSKKEFQNKIEEEKKTNPAQGALYDQLNKNVDRFIKAGGTNEVDQERVKKIAKRGANETLEPDDFNYTPEEINQAKEFLSKIFPGFVEPVVILISQRLIVRNPDGSFSFKNKEAEEKLLDLIDKLKAATDLTGDQKAILTKLEDLIKKIKPADTVTSTSATPAGTIPDDIKRAIDTDIAEGTKPSDVKSVDAGNKVKIVHYIRKGTNKPAFIIWYSDQDSSRNTRLAFRGTYKQDYLDKLEKDEGYVFLRGQKLIDFVSALTLKGENANEIKNKKAIFLGQDDYLQRPAGKNSVIERFGEDFYNKLISLRERGMNLMQDLVLSISASDKTITNLIDGSIAEVEHTEGKGVRNFVPLTN
ncbi:MAG: hypothetical protein HYY52_05665 [Candidatus Melainabacteria bacterium]|nr:hypothetical protein [Candidatus Melainabacteria bacterium]